MATDPARDAVPRGNAVIRLLLALEDGLLIFVLGAMILLAFSKIAMRFCGLGLAWIDPLLRHLVLWIGLLGAMAASRSHNHLAVDALTQFLPPRPRCAARAVTHLFTATVCAVLVYACYDFLLWEYEDGYMAFDHIPAWVMELIIPLAFGVIGLRYLLSGLGNLLALVRGRVPTEEQ